MVLSFAALSAPVDAQTTTGGITGVVQDAGGGVLPGVTVKATHEATNAETTAVSNEVGIYVLRGLPVGRYTVLAELSGFQTLEEHRRRRSRERGRPARHRAESRAP